MIPTFTVSSLLVLSATVLLALHPATVIAAIASAAATIFFTMLPSSKKLIFNECFNYSSLNHLLQDEIEQCSIFQPDYNGIDGCLGLSFDNPAIVTVFSLFRPSLV
jgi:hypothetical protein